MCLQCRIGWYLVYSIRPFFVLEKMMKYRILVQLSNVVTVGTAELIILESITRVCIWVVCFES